jgi:hypothetical protein
MDNLTKLKHLAHAASDLADGIASIDSKLESLNDASAVVGLAIRREVDSRENLMAILDAVENQRAALAPKKETLEQEDFFGELGL